jgi:hypothetical protein
MMQDKVHYETTCTLSRHRRQTCSQPLQVQSCSRVYIVTFLSCLQKGENSTGPISFACTTLGFVRPAGTTGSRTSQIQGRSHAIPHYASFSRFHAIHSHHKTADRPATPLLYDVNSPRYDGGAGTTPFAPKTEAAK